jgi:hypothetical protein
MTNENSNLLPKKRGGRPKGSRAQKCREFCNTNRLTPLVSAGSAVKMFLRHIPQLNLGSCRGGVPNDAVFGAAGEAAGRAIARVRKEIKRLGGERIFGCGAGPPLGRARRCGRSPSSRGAAHSWTGGEVASCRIAVRSILSQ